MAQTYYFPDQHTSEPAVNDPRQYPRSKSNRTGVVKRLPSSSTYSYTHNKSPWQKRALSVTAAAREDGRGALWPDGTSGHARLTRWPGGQARCESLHRADIIGKPYFHCCFGCSLLLNTPHTFPEYVMPATAPTHGQLCSPALSSKFACNRVCMQPFQHVPQKGQLMWINYMVPSDDSLLQPDICGELNARVRASFVLTLHGTRVVHKSDELLLWRSGLSGYE